MYLWMLGSVVVFYGIRFMWKAYTHPAHTLGRQAANMNWVANGRVEDEHGYKNVCVTRGGIDAVISYKNGDVTLIGPMASKRFKDFMEIERWLATTDGSPSPVKRPSEDDAVARALWALAEIENHAENAAFAEVKQRLEALIKDADKTKYSVDKEGVAPRDLVLLLITNVIQDIMCTGRYHVYRGVLGGVGQDLLRLWDYACDQMAASGYHSEAEVNKDKAWLRQEIKIVG